ncbi:MAG: 4Fe-4S binding protein [Elusimicrobia bacterium]|nr:4Fe-4S binding protein [Elusimicrobiota bacterium]
MRKALPLILFALLLTIGGLLRQHHDSTPKDRAPFSCESSLPSGTLCERRTDPFPHIAASPPQGETVYLVTAQDLDLQPRGYGGPMDIGVVLNGEARIKDVRIIRHQESPSYLKSMEAFLHQFMGKGPTAPLELKTDIDAITRATVSSEAVTLAVRQIRDRFRRELLGIPSSLPKHNPTTPVEKILLFSTGILLLISGTLAIIHRNVTLRWITMAGGFLFFGLMTASMLSIVQIIHIGLGNSPSPSVNILWWLTLVIGIVPTLLLGRIYCGTLCPFGILQEALHKMVQHPEKIPPSTYRGAQRTKVLLLFGLTALCLWQGSSLPAEGMEPFVPLFTGTGTRIAWAFMVMMIIASIFYYRFFCAHLCPVGAMTGLLSRFSLFRIKPQKGCSSCGQCVAACPVQAMAPGRSSDGTDRPLEVVVDPAECLLCGKCLTICPEQCLRLSRTGIVVQAHIPKETGRRQRDAAERIFIAFLLGALLLLGGVVGSRIAEPPFLTTAQDPASAANDPAGQRLKETLAAAGLSPHEARYWRETP